MAKSSAERENIKATLVSMHQIGADYVKNRIDGIVLAAMLQSEVDAIKRMIRK